VQRVGERVASSHAGVQRAHEWHDVPVRHDHGAGDQTGGAAGDEGADEAEGLVALEEDVAARLARCQHDPVRRDASLVELLHGEVAVAEQQ
jgi:hypothetical protein